MNSVQTVKMGVVYIFFEYIFGPSGILNISYTVLFHLQLYMVTNMCRCIEKCLCQRKIQIIALNQVIVKTIELASTNFRIFIHSMDFRKVL